MIRLVVCTAFAVATSALSVLALHQRNLLVDARRQYTTASVYQPYVSRSRSLWREKSRESESDIRRTRFPVSIKIGEEVCVELRLNRGSAGGSPVYCFEIDSKKLTRRFDDVE